MMVFVLFFLKLAATIILNDENTKDIRRFFPHFSPWRAFQSFAASALLLTLQFREVLLIVPDPPGWFGPFAHLTPCLSLMTDAS